MLCLCAQLLAITSTTTAQPFTTVINVPPDIAPGSIGSDTQLNLFDGGTIDSLGAGLRNEFNSNIEVNISGGVVDHGIQAGNFRATNTNVFVNVSGGTVAGITANSGSTVNISDGSVGNVWANAGSVVNFSGGSLGDRTRADRGSTFNISGGSVGRFFEAGSHSTVNISGGTIGDLFSVGFNADISISGGVVPEFQIFADGTLNISGGNLGGFSGFSGEATITGSEFQFNGAPIPGLESPGDSVTFPTTSTGLLTTTFADGAVFAIQRHTLGDTLTLNVVAAPAKPATINTPSDPAPLGLRSGQTLNLSDGATLNDNFYAVDATLNMSGGSVGRHLEVMGTSVDITGGSVDEYFRARSGSTVNISGGAVGHGVVLSNSTATITGGTIKGSIDVGPDSQLDFQGGTIGRNSEFFSGSTVNITGDSLRLDGVPVPGLETPGLTVGLNLPADSILTGRLTDGSVFVFSTQSGDKIADGTLKFTTTSAPTAGPSVINVPADTAPKGLWVGQTLNLSEGGVLGDNFAAVEATMNITGGTVGQSMEVVDSVVTVTGGDVGLGLTALMGSTIDIRGGNVGEGLSILSGSVVNISGGTVAGRGVIGSFDGTSADATLNISGGHVGEFFQTSPGTTVNISGGEVGDTFIVGANSTVNISGGGVNHAFRAKSGSTVNISGGEFFLDGVLVPGLDTLGTSTGVNIPPDSRLTVTLTDGTVRTFGSTRLDLIADGTLNLIRAPIPTAKDVVNVPVDPAPRGLRIGQALNLSDGGILRSDFTTGIGSTVNIDGGEVGDRFTAEINSTVNISGGIVGNSFNAFSGSTVNISGGSIGVVSSVLDKSFIANSGSTVNISGGVIGTKFKASSGSIVNILGGNIGNAFVAFPDSTVNLTGSSFILDGVDLTAGLTPDELFTITDRNVRLEGMLADGSPFSFNLSSNGNFNADFFHTTATLTVTLVPEPGALALLGVGGLAILRRRHVV